MTVGVLTIFGFKNYSAPALLYSNVTWSLMSSQNNRILGSMAELIGSCQHASSVIVVYFALDVKKDLKIPVSYSDWGVKLGRLEVGTVVFRQNICCLCKSLQFN